MLFEMGLPSFSTVIHNVPFISQLPKYAIPFLLIVQSPTLSSFKRHLKTHYFESAYPAPSAHPQCALILFSDFGAL